MTTQSATATAALLAVAARGGLAAIADLAGVRVARTLETEGNGHHIWGEALSSWEEASAEAERVAALAHRAGYRVTDVRPEAGVTGYPGHPHAEVSVIDRFHIREEDGALYTWRSTHPDNVEAGDVLRDRTGAAVTVEAGVRLQGVVESIYQRNGGWTPHVYRRESATLED